MILYCLDLPFMAHSSCSRCMDLPFMVDPIDLSAVCGLLEFSRSTQLSLLDSSDAANDGFIKLHFSLKSLLKQWPKQC